MKLDVEIDAADINEHVAKAIMDSALGEAIANSIADRLSDYNLQSAIDEAVKSTVSKIIYELLQQEHGDELREAIKTRLSDGIVSDLAGKAFDQWLSNRG